MWVKNGWQMLLRPKIFCCVVRSDGANQYFGRRWRALAFHDRFWKSELIDFVILQQDAFDAIDASTPMERQKYMLSSVLGVADAEFKYKGFEDVSRIFSRR